MKSEVILTRKSITAKPKAEIVKADYGCVNSKYYSSQITNPDSAWYLTPSKGQLPSYFRITISGRVIRQSLQHSP